MITRFRHVYLEFYDKLYTMSRTLIKDTINKVGETVLINGWVSIRRDHGKIIFLDVWDRSGVIQIVCTTSTAGVGDAVEITGLVKARPEKLVNPKLATGTVELEAKEITVLAKSETYPFDMGKPELDLELPTLLDYRSLTLRHPKVQAIFKVQAVIVDAFRQALLAKDFLEFQAPLIISAIPEGGAEVFRVKYFDKEAYLSQSPQLYKSLLVGAFERVFSVNQIFRAEPSVTTRHITVATSLDAEFGFIKSMQDVLDMEEYVVRFIFKEIQEKCAKELELFGATLPKLAEKIPLIKLREAQKIIYDRTGRDVRQEKDFAPEDEREICKWSLETKGSDLVFVSHFPTKKKPFYVYPDPEDPEYAYSVDLLGRGVEWSSGGQRLNDYRVILDHLKEWGLKKADVELYLQAFKYGIPPLGGFALGAERMTMHILGLANIREASMFPRDLERIDVRLSTQPKIVSNVFAEIKKLLDSNNITYEVYEHEAVFTSEQAAKIRGTELKQGAKAMVMFGDDKPLMIVLPANLKVNMSSIKNLRMATKEEVKKLTNTEIGAVPPFGNLFGLPVYIDEKLGENTEIAFNAGEHTKSIKMLYKDFEAVTKPILGSFSQ